MYKWLILVGFLKVMVNTKSLANCESPKCDACEFGKGRCQPDKINISNINPMNEKDFKKDSLMHG